MHFILLCAGRPGQTEASEAAESLGREASRQAVAVLYAGFGSVARAVSGAGEQSKITGHMASVDAYHLADQAANLAAMYYGQAAAAIGEIVHIPSFTTLTFAQFVWETHVHMAYCLLRVKTQLRVHGKREGLALLAVCSSCYARYAC